MAEEEKEKKPSPPLGSVKLSLMGIRPKDKKSQSVKNMQNNLPPETSPPPSALKPLLGEAIPLDSIHASSHESTMDESKLNQKSTHAKILTKVRELKHSFRKRTTSETSLKEEEGWILFKQGALNSVFIHEQLFNQVGITAFRWPFTTQGGLAGPSHFSFNNRVLSFIDESKKDTASSIPSSAQKTKSLIRQFQQFADQRIDKTQPIAVADSLPLEPRGERAESSEAADRELKSIPSKSSSTPIKDSALAHVSNKDDNKPNTIIIFNPARREEVFCPFVVNRGREQQKFGLHIYPWLSKSKDKLNFEGFSSFVTAMCMFGPSLKGVDQKGASFPLIKHEDYLFTEQMIVSIDIGTQPSAYETAQFEEFEKLMYLVKELSATSSPPQLHCHLPHYDYILFCLQLWMNEKMTEEALEQAVTIILQKRNEYTRRINRICKNSGIAAAISSPYDNIFGKSNSYEQVAKVFDELMNIESDGQERNEQSLVQNTLKLLTSNKLQTQHHQTWQDYLAWSCREKTITTLEDLFKAGNAIIPATISRGKTAYQVCSLLPLSEKQIQVGHADFSKKLEAYPAIVNFTYLDSFLGYNQTNKGRSFYFSDSQTIAKQLISLGILQDAYKNAGTTPGSKDHKPLRKVLEKLAPPQEEGSSQSLLDLTPPDDESQATSSSSTTFS